MNPPAPASPEARRSTRHAPASPAPVVDEMRDRVLGMIVDLSAGGMKLLAAVPLVDGALYQVQFALDVPGEGRIPLEAGMQVVSGRPSPEGDVAGLRFIHMQEPDSRRLAYWLRARGGGDRH